MLDLGKFTGKKTRLLDVVEQCIAQRQPPMLPADFAAALERKSFTNGRTDRPLVSALYAGIFAQLMAKVTDLRYGSVSWGDDEIAALCVVIRSREMDTATSLRLTSNRIGDAGAQAIASTVAEGALPRLKLLVLRNNNIGYAGMIALATAVSDGALPSCTKKSSIDLLNNPSDEGQQAVKDALENRA